MRAGVRSTSIFTFGDFQLDCRSHELRKRGRSLRVQRQSFDVLWLLVAARGNVVTREELRDAVWARDTHVDFDRGINKAVGSSADSTICSVRRWSRRLISRWCGSGL